jgi:predicted Rossmann fold nucleotide-binding protein DprA/Smf involved in DNA uptake
MTKNALEDQLAALTREFVGKLVEALRNASLADVAALSSDPAARLEREARPNRAREARESNAVPPRAPSLTPGRQTAARRAEVGERVTLALRSASEPMGVRALATELGVEPTALAVPLRELRAAGRIRKHGEKRATTYSLA